MALLDNEPVKRAAEVCRPLHGLIIIVFANLPALKRWAILGRPLARTNYRHRCLQSSFASFARRSQIFRSFLNGINLQTSFFTL